MLVHDYGIKRKPITVRNPQANAIVERIHQVIANMVRMFELETNYLDVDHPWKGVLSAIAFAERLTYHIMLPWSISVWERYDLQYFTCGQLGVDRSNQTEVD